jgi:dTDP-4-dehydrorhamnose 3,5-epimerase
MPASPVADATTEIAGVHWGRLRAHADERGAFRELGRAGALGQPFVQANLSLSRAGVLRGLHYHRRQLDHWVVLDGEVFVALVDLRNLREKGGRPVTRVLATDDTVTIPQMVGHGFLALAPTRLLYLVTNEYDNTDELGLAWDDPELAVAWPTVATPDGRPILSDRDHANPSLAELRDGLAVSH